MKKFFLISTALFFLFFHQCTIAQVVIEESPYIDQQISVPIADKTFAEYLLRSQSKDTYLLVDTCDMQFVYSPTGIFSGQSLRRVQLFVDGELRMMQMFLPNENHWQLYPNEYLGFPYGNQDSTLFTFVADIPDTTLSFPQTTGEYLRTILTCRYHFATNTTESFETNTETGQTLVISSITSGVPEFEAKKLPVGVDDGRILILDPPVEIRNSLSQRLSVLDGQLYVNVEPGFYFYTKRYPKGETHGKIVVQ